MFTVQLSQQFLQAYEDVALTFILVTQIYLNIAIALSMHRSATERRRQREQLTLTREQLEQAKNGNSGEQPTDSGNH